MNPRLSLILLALLVMTLLNACSVHEIQQSPALGMRENWMMLPFENHSDTPDVGERAADIAEVLLRSQRGLKVSKYQANDAEGSLPELNQQKLVNSAIAWAKQNNVRYGVTGNIYEWRYKSGLEGEPAVGIALKVVDIGSGEIVWSATGSKTGWGRESVSGTAHKLLEELIDGLPLRN